MVEISRIGYKPASCRSPREVLRLHNQSFLHAMWCKTLVGKTPKALTRRKFFGRYWHSLTTHAPIVYRMISLSSIHTEEEERTFNQIQSIASRTSSRRHDEIIVPTLVRIQAEQREREASHQSSFGKQNSKVCKFASALPSPPNSTIPHGFLIKSPRECQAHMERVSDFLLRGENVWWRRDIRGVEFMDADTEMETRQAGPFLHHFRSTNIKQEEEYLKNCWKSCLNDDITIPLITIRQKTSHNKYTEIQTHYLENGNDSDTADQGEEDPRDVGVDNEFEAGRGKDVEEEFEEGAYDEDTDQDADEVEVGFEFQEEEDISSDKESDLTDEVVHDQTEKSLPPVKNPPPQIAAAIPSTPPTKSLKTSLAANIFTVLPDNFDIVQEFDKARVSWKESITKKKQSNYSRFWKTNTSLFLPEFKQESWHRMIL